MTTGTRPPSDTVMPAEAGLGTQIDELFRALMSHIDFDPRHLLVFYARRKQYETILGTRQVVRDVFYLDNSLASKIYEEEIKYDPVLGYEVGRVRTWYNWRTGKIAVRAAVTFGYDSFGDDYIEDAVQAK